MSRRPSYDAIVLDVMLPGMDGFETCRALRADGGLDAGADAHGARRTVEDRIAGLDVGADDYLAKPFSFDELLARLRALRRRGAPRASDGASGRRAPPRSGRRREVRRGETEIALSAKEFTLLETLMRRAGEVLSRVPAARAGLGRRLRQPLERRRRVRLLPARQDRPAVRTRPIETVRGVGYRLRADGGAERASPSGSG